VLIENQDLEHTNSFLKDTIPDWRKIVDDLEFSIKLFERKGNRPKTSAEVCYRMLYYWAVEHLIDMLLSRIGRHTLPQHQQTNQQNNQQTGGISGAQALLVQVVMLREKSRSCFEASAEAAPLSNWSLTRLTDHITR
jgi:hypothetical protein